MALKDELEENFDIKDITFDHLQDEKTGPLVIEFYKKLNQKSQGLMHFLYY